MSVRRMRTFKRAQDSVKLPPRRAVKTAQNTADTCRHPYPVRKVVLFNFWFFCVFFWVLWVDGTGGWSGRMRWWVGEGLVGGRSERQGGAETR